MAELQHNQIRQKLQEQVVPAINGSDLPDNSGKADHLLSRAVAAVCVRIKTNVEISTAAESIVDGSDDNGLDAIYHDISNGTLTLVQSKWSSTHSSSIDSGSVLKFLQGVKDLISQKKSKF